MRLFITLLSMGSVIAFGYALAGYAGYAFGHVRLGYIVYGLLLGILMGALSFWLWRQWMPLFFMEESESESEAPTP